MNATERAQWLRRLHAGHTAADPTAALHLREGKMADYQQLAQHHYRAARPATATRVWVFESDHPTLRTRLTGQDNQPTIAAVLVESLPALSCRMRDFALHERYGSLKNCRERATLLNAELRCISRVVVHPQWRGLGLAVRLVKHALQTAVTPFTEALAAMGRINPFFTKAGMTPYERPPHAYDDRLLAAMARLGLGTCDLSMLQRVHDRLDQCEPAQRQWFERELQRWFSRNGGRRHSKQATLTDQLTAARDRLLLKPVYYLHVNSNTQR